MQFSYFYRKSKEKKADEKKELISRWNLQWLRYCLMLLAKCIMGYYSIVVWVISETPKLSIFQLRHRQGQLVTRPAVSLRGRSKAGPGRRRKSSLCCLRSDKLVNCHVWKFYKDLFLNCRVSSWPDLSIKSYFLMVSSLILLRSLRVYILKQLFFSISVNSGFRNIYLATSWLGKYFATIHLNFKE